MNVIRVEYTECYEAVSSFTKRYFEYPNDLMYLSSFKDINDPGDYERCEDIPGARFNYFQVIPTGLPLNLRFGV